MGICTFGYLTLKLSFWCFRGMYEQMRSFFNSNKYLKSTNPESVRDEKYYAVIYGAGNTAGKIFAKYLSEKGFNLILIERNMKQLEDLTE